MAFIAIGAIVALVIWLAVECYFGLKHINDDEHHLH